MSNQFSRQQTLVSISGFFSALIYIYLSFLSIDGPNLFQFFTLLGFAALILAFSWFYLHKKQIQPKVWEILVWAIAFRIIGVLGEPLLEDDFYRYLWDGYMLVTSGSPYGVAPEVFFDRDFGLANTELSDQLSDLLGSINHPQIATIYGPVCQWLFALSYQIAPAQVWPLQLGFALFDLGIVLMLLKVARPVNVLLYAWCPLLIKEFAFTAHTDVMAVFFVLAACLAVRARCWLLVGVLAALAVGSKIFALVMVPFLLVKNWRSCLTFFFCMLALYAPFAGDLFNSEHGLTAMASGWVFNAPIYYLLIDFEWQLKTVLLVTFFLSWLVYAYSWYKKGGEEIPRGDWLFGGFLFILPVLNAWYLVWVLPFATIWPSRTAWVASLAVLLSYATGLTMSSPGLIGYQQPISILLLEYGLIIAALICDCREKRAVDTSQV